MSILLWEEGKKLEIWISFFSPFFHIQHITKSFRLFWSLCDQSLILPPAITFCLDNFGYANLPGVTLMLPASLSVALKDNYRTAPRRQLTPRSPFAYPTGFVIATFPLSPKLFCHTPFFTLALYWAEGCSFKVACPVILEISEPLLFCLGHCFLLLY